mmetsp:Transcript_5421/g.16708  ORF Transcript_5421/g.16708 Transcript_5421/m.16708 type:complete len:182 (-) Transcript_5421:273-818(-)
MGPFVKKRQKCRHALGRPAGDVDEFCRARWMGWDALLMVLSCFIGAKTLILDTSANDNGLFHEELADYDAPGSWPTIDGGLGLNAARVCLKPFGDGAAPPDVEELLSYYAETRKFGLVDPVANGFAAPCALRTFRREATVRGKRDMSRHVACGGHMSEAHAEITTSHVFPWPGLNESRYFR